MSIKSYSRDILCDPGAFNSCVCKSGLKKNCPYIVQLKNISDTYPCFLDKRAKWTTPHHQQILDASSFNALLLTDLATNLSSAPQVQQRDELGESVHDTTFTQLFGILSENVAWAKIGDDAWKFFNTSKYFNIKLLYNGVQPASNSPAIQN